MAAEATGTSFLGYSACGPIPTLTHMLFFSSLTLPLKDLILPSSLLPDGHLPALTGPGGLR